MQMLDSLMGLAVFLFVLGGIAGLGWFAAKGIDWLIKCATIRLAKYEVDSAYWAMQKEKSLKNCHRYAMACSRYYVAKYGDYGSFL